MSATFPKTAELNLIMCVPNIFWYTVRQDLESAREILNTPPHKKKKKSKSFEPKSKARKKKSPPKKKN